MNETQIDHCELRRRPGTPSRPSSTSPSGLQRSVATHRCIYDRGYSAFGVWGSGVRLVVWAHERGDDGACVLESLQRHVLSLSRVRWNSLEISYPNRGLETYRSNEERTKWQIDTCELGRRSNSLYDISCPKKAYENQIANARVFGRKAIQGEESQHERETRGEKDTSLTATRARAPRRGAAGKRARSRKNTLKINFAGSAARAVRVCATRRRRRRVRGTGETRHASDG